MTPDDSTRPPHDPHVAFRYRDFRFFAISRLLAVIGWQMQSVAVSWQIYAMTHKPIHLGYIGLVQFLPNAAFALLTGHVADRFDRRQIVRVCQGLIVLCSLTLALLTLGGVNQIGWFFLVMFLIGTAFAFQSPASQALVPLIVGPEHLSNAVTWNNSIWHLATIVGPGLGGLFYWLGDHYRAALGGPAIVYITGATLILGALVATTLMRVRTGGLEKSSVSWETVMAGVHYVFQNKVILGCISLDLFAVLLGGAVALLPVYAHDILKVESWGLGLMRGAPAIGAMLTALLVTHLPPMRRAGATMLWCVAGFGLATVIFGLSRSFPLSLACLLLMGCFDMVSVIVRHTLVQTLTPKEMLGRVSAVNMVFIGASNELGEFESGVTAKWWGAVPAVIFGGIGTIAVVALWAWMFPAMRRIGRLDHEVHPSHTAPEQLPAQSESPAQ